MALMESAELSSPSVLPLTFLGSPELSRKVSQPPCRRLSPGYNPYVMDTQAQIDRLREARWKLALVVVRLQEESEAMLHATGKTIALVDHYADRLRDVMFDLSGVLPQEFESGDALEILKDGCPKT